MVMSMNTDRILAYVLFFHCRCVRSLESGLAAEPNVQTLRQEPTRGSSHARRSSRFLPMVLSARLPCISLLVKLVLAAIFFTALALLKTYPLIRHFAYSAPWWPRRSSVSHLDPCLGRPCSHHRSVQPVQCQHLLPGAEYIGAFRAHACRAPHLRPCLSSDGESGHRP